MIMYGELKMMEVQVNNCGFGRNNLAENITGHPSG
jgi:hypothetical protein